MKHLLQYFEIKLFIPWMEKSLGVITYIFYPHLFLFILGGYKFAF